MTYDYLMVHYGELSTKGDNRKQFIECLIHNIRTRLKEDNVKVKGERDHCYILLNGCDHLDIVNKLGDVSGISRISLVAKTERDIKEIKEAALELIKAEEGSTFKIDVKRSDKTYELDSYQVAVAVADNILDNTSLTVDLHNHDILMRINIREDACYLSCHDYPGLGGYPLGMCGKVLMFLSGGIDSPVAAYSLLRRGIKIECLHFASPPYTSDRVIEKLQDLLKKLNIYQPSIKLHIVPFTKIQETIYEKTPEPYCITIMRRMMLRIGEKAAKRYKCLAIATGESIGQVASQTLDSLNVINSVTSFPIIRPLATSDKVSIIETARKIDTFDISIRPYEDCCTIFKPKRPKTKPHLEECLKSEEIVDYDSLIKETVDNIETKVIGE